MSAVYKGKKTNRNRQLDVGSPSVWVFVKSPNRNCVRAWYVEKYVTSWALDKTTCSHAVMLFFEKKTIQASTSCLTVFKPHMDFVGDGFDKFNAVLWIIFLVSEQLVRHLLQHCFHSCVTEPAGNAQWSLAMATPKFAQLLRIICTRHWRTRRRIFLQKIMTGVMASGWRGALGLLAIRAPKIILMLYANLDSFVNSTQLNSTQV